MTKGNQLREILSKPGILALPGLYDCVSALIAEKTGFEAAFTSGFSISASTLGKPDFGYLSATEMLWSVSRIVRSVNLPIIVDIDTGYGNPLNVIQTVEEIVRIGGGGIILEDQEWPKKCGHFEGKRVISMDEHVEKIRAAVHARGESGLVIVGRTDSRASHGLDDAIKRGHEYYKAGADIVFVEAPQSVEELKEVASAFPGVPLLANMVEGGKTPFLSTDELESLGYKIVVYGLSVMFSAAKAIELCLKHVKDNGTSRGFENMLEFKDFEKVIGTENYRELESRFKSGS